MAFAGNCFTERQELLWSFLRSVEPRCDAMIVSSPHNIRYLTGFTGSNGLVIVTDSATYFFTDPRYRLQAASEVTATVRTVTGPLMNHAAALLVKKKLRSVGYEQDRITAGHLDLLKSKLTARFSFEPRGGAVEMLRMVKSADEIAAIRQSVLTNSRALDETLKHIQPEITEAELAAEIDYRMRRLGAEGPAFDTIVAAGERSALPHAKPTRAKIGQGILLIDMGAFENGYASDMTRTMFLGVPPRPAVKMYKAVLEAQLAAIDAVRPGVKAAQVDAAARRVLKSHGYDKAFMHSTGHGLGLEIHEPPRLGKKEQTKLKEGMAITIEPGAYIENEGGVRIEDTVVVTVNGCEVLTPTSKKLLVL